MCNFVSWIERRGKVKFLSDTQYQTKKGKELMETISLDDIYGHGTIRAYYGIDAGDGIDKECSDFSTPDNFPKVIVNAIKAGKMTSMPLPLSLLTDEAELRLENSAELDKAWSEWDKAWAEYEKASRNKASWEIASRYKANARAAWYKASAEEDKTRFKLGWAMFAIPENRIPCWR